MSSRLYSITHSPSFTLLIIESLALLELGVIFIADHWPDTATSPPPSAIIGALFLLFAICTSLAAAIMLLINIFRKRIDLGTIIAFVPFLGFSIWGIWYSYTDPHWLQNLPIFWVVFGITTTLWLYTIIQYIKHKKI